MGMKVKVVMAEDHAILRESLAHYIEKKADQIELTGLAMDWRDVANLLESGVKCDVALLDIMMPGGDGLNMVQIIRAKFPNVKILIFSSLSEEEYAFRFIKAGASGFVSKVDSPKKIIQSILSVADGEIIISEDLRKKLSLERIMNVETVSELEILTEREFQVMVQLGAGKSQSEVAGLLNLSPRTVNTHRNNILRKMNWRNNAEMMFYVIKKNLIHQ